MARKKKQPIYPNSQYTFNPQTDKPLQNFSTDVVCVSVSELGTYKLFINGYCPIMFDRYGYIQKFPACTQEHEQFVRAFLHEYVPHFNYEKQFSSLKTTHPFYIGTPETVTL